MHDELHKLGANKIVGTAYYVSPEVLARDYNEKCDLWSLGILLHIITTATAPFSGENDL
jgi:calcium-dependent protein kinase